ncbi:MAG: heme ABC exporter ATP-binding protein CcmA [Longimicrobiales bacterium]|nr:heme ABC exporter ATP-binding protein CcmA [Longimicrobiales bacterium]
MTDGIVIEGVAKRFGRKWALRGASFEADPGTALALMGHNGSGKTTLLRVVATTLRPTRGGGTVFGWDLLKETDAIRHHVGALYHAPGVYGDLTARENLEFARRMWGGEGEVSVEEALDRVGLGRVVDERAAGFSSGMTRRLALARLVMRPPRLLLLDEPYASFDADGIELVNEMVRATADAGGITLVATHDPERSAAVVDRVVTLQEGRVVPTPGPQPALKAEVAP